jgi:hypothetical protein
MTPISQAQVIGELARHVGQANGVHVRDLVTRITGQSVSCAFMERRVRTLVTELRLEGSPICGNPASGYFFAETAAELEDTCSFLRSRAMSSLVIESRLRRISMPELLGQMLLPT